MGRTGNTGLNVGGASILVIFVLLCLTTFATLSMVSANADLKLTQRTAQAAREYYEADARAEELLLRAEELLAALRASAGTGQDYLGRAVRELPGEIPEFTGERAPDGAALLRCSIRIGESQELSVVLEVLSSPGAQGRNCLRREWAVRNLEEEVPAEESPFEGLWDGAEPPFPLG